MCSVSRPAPFADGENARAAARAVCRVAQQHAGRAVAEQRGGHEHRRARIVDAQAQAAQVDGEEQHMRALGRVRQPRRPRQAGDAAAAAETEDRQPFHRRLKLEAIEQFCVEARYRKAGDRIGDENVDCVELDAGRCRCLERHIGQEIDRMFLKNGGALFPRVRLEIPLDRLAIVAKLDTGIVIERPQSLEMRENLFGAPGGFGLAELEGRIGGRDRQNLDVETARGRGCARLGPDSFQHMELPCLPARCINTARVLDRPAVTKFRADCSPPA